MLAKHQDVFVNNYYHPQTKLREGNIFTPDGQSFCSQVGGGRGACMARGMVVGGMFGMGVCVALGHVWPEACVTGGVHGGGHAAGWHVWWEGMHAGKIATEAGSMHPTGMHSCKHCVCVLWYQITV